MKNEDKMVELLAESLRNQDKQAEILDRQSTILEQHSEKLDLVVEVMKDLTSTVKHNTNAV